MKNNGGPQTDIAIWADTVKYRQEGEDYSQKIRRLVTALLAVEGTDKDRLYSQSYEMLFDQRVLFGGRVQAAVGASKQVTAFNCFVMAKVPDSLTGIMDNLKEAALTMKMGGGVGFDFSGIRPEGAPIKTLGSAVASGPLSYMDMWDSLCATIMSAGMRRGAMMATMRCDHPDILKFITAKNNNERLRRFNLSILVTDAFMAAVKTDSEFDLVFEGKTYETVRALDLWDAMMYSTWDWAEPGVIFVDRINFMNNLHYIENITATNPCGEQPLPPYGACLLASHNLTQYAITETGSVDSFDKVAAPAELCQHSKHKFDWETFGKDIELNCRLLDNVIDETTYPLAQQESEAKNKRRMGIGYTGLGNLFGWLGLRYGSEESLEFVERLGKFMANRYYFASAMLAKEKGAFPLFEVDKYMKGEFIKQLEPYVQDAIRKYGIRNSHLLSIAPTGTISLSANNVSSGLEPVFAYSYDRKIQTEKGEIVAVVEDYALAEWNIKCTQTSEVTAQEHVAILAAATKWVDSACSKTCNVGADMTFEEFKDVYMQAYDQGAKGCTTFRANGKRFAMMTAPVETEEEKEEETKMDFSAMAKEIEGDSCTFDPATGIKTCDSI